MWQAHGQRHSFWFRLRRPGTDAPYQYGVQGHYARVCSEKPFHEPKIAESLPTILPPHEPPLANGLPTILPLPFRRGEGRGEGNRLGNIAGSRFQYASKNEKAFREPLVGAGAPGDSNA